MRMSLKEYQALCRDTAIRRLMSNTRKHLPTLLAEAYDTGHRDGWIERNEDLMSYLEEQQKQRKENERKPICRCNSGAVPDSDSA